MATYTYYFADTLTGNVLHEFPLYGVNMDKRVNGAGNFTGTFPLGTGVYLDQHLLDASIPGKNSVVCNRNGEDIWGGPIMSRTYGSNGMYAQLTAQTWESVFDHVVFEAHVIQQNVEQVTLLQNVITQMQGQTGNNFGFTFSLPGATGKLRTILLPDYEFHFVSDAINQIIGVDDGLEYTIDLTSSGVPGKPNRVLRAGFPNLDSGAITDAYDYPGTVSEYWYSESAANGAVKFAAIGVIPYGKQPNEVLRAVAIDGDKIAAGWPSFWQTRAYPTVGDAETIAGKSKQGLIDNGMPAVNPTFALDNADMFTSWNSLGDAFQVTIFDPRFPTGTAIQRRLVGWNLTPQSSDSDEALQFVIDGSDL